MSKKKKQKKLFKISPALILGVGGLLGYLVFIPSLSISPAVTLDPANPFATPFILENKSIFSVYSVEAKAFIIDAQDKDNNGIHGGISIMDNSSKFPRLQGNKEAVVGFTPSFGNQDMLGLHYPLRCANIYISVRYTPFLWPWRQEKIFGFRIASTMDAETLWLPVVENQPVPTCEPHPR